MSTVLDRIVSSKRVEVAEAKSRLPESELRGMCRDAAPVRSFADALTARPGVQLIAEVKRASPSAGVIREDFDPVAIAEIYSAHGAAAISVLTDEPFFQGSLDYLEQVRARVPLPVLRKDFVVDRYQVIEARARGADAVLLIAEILPHDELASRLADIHELGMEALVELYDADNLPRVVACGARVIGINNRDLRTFETSLEHTTQLAPHVPADRILVSESGIRSRADLDRLQAAGARAVLVGETLMRSPDIGQAVRKLLHG